MEELEDKIVEIPTINIKFIGKSKEKYKKRLKKYKILEDEVIKRGLAFSLKEYLKKEYSHTSLRDLKKQIRNLKDEVKSINIKRTLLEFGIPVKNRIKKTTTRSLILNTQETKIFRENVKLYLCAKGISIKEISEKLNVTPHCLSQIISGDRRENLSFVLAYKISKVLDIDIDNLLAKAPLDISPFIKEFLNKKESEKYLKILIDYLDSNRDELSLSNFKNEIEKAYICEE